MGETANPFAALSLIVAPAVLTNASSILILSTSNRLARAIDRARTLAAQMELLNPLRLFYASLRAFAGAALTSLLGGALSGREYQTLSSTAEAVSVGAGVIGVAGLLLGCVLLLRETRLAVLVVSEEATLLREHFADRPAPQ